MTAPGTRYRNTSGRTLYGFFPPDAVVEVRDDGLDELVTLEYDPADAGSENGVKAAVVLPPGDLENNFEKVEDPTDG